jgi:hypothetical protein
VHAQGKCQPSEMGWLIVVLSSWSMCKSWTYPNIACNFAIMSSIAMKKKAITCRFKFFMMCNRYALQLVLFVIAIYKKRHIHMLGWSVEKAVLLHWKTE